MSWGEDGKGATNEAMTENRVNKKEVRRTTKALLGSEQKPRKGKGKEDKICLTLAINLTECRKIYTYSAYSVHSLRQLLGRVDGGGNKGEIKKRFF